MKVPFIQSVLVLASLAMPWNGLAHAGDEIDFQSQVRPILSQNCFRCHGPDQAARKADLRLDTHEVITLSRPGGTRIIVPGDPTASELYRRITAVHGDDRMPPTDSGLSLSPGEIDLVRRWIEEGATWQRHWAFLPPERSRPGRDEVEEIDVDAIDRHVHARLAGTGLEPSPRTDRATLLRRVTFDLTGLPPTIEELDAFLSDERPDAYERVVDRLLASPTFGERLATPWLDLARYADTYGYQTDRAREVWPYRDWVIKAFNENLPYDDFVTWQLAGDLLPEASRDQRLATAFNRLHRQTNEGGSVEEEYRVEYVADRVHTFGTAMLGMTTECARCHDHKFDPISQREYYQLFAFFDDINESGLYSHFTNAVPTPALLLTTTEQDETIATLRTNVADAEAALSKARDSSHLAFEAWRNSAPTELGVAGLVGHYPMDEIEENGLQNLVDATRPGQVNGGPASVEAVQGMGLELSGENNARFPEVAAFARTDPFSISLWINVPEWTDRAVILHRSRSWTDAGSQGYQFLVKEGQPSWSLIHFWPGNAISIRGIEPLEVDRWVQVTVTSDGSASADGLSMYIDGQPVEVEIVQDNLTKPITGGGPGAMTIGQRFRDRGFKNGKVDDLRIFNRALTPVEARHLFDGQSVTDVLAGDPVEAFDYYLANHDEAWQVGRENLQAARRELALALDAPPEIMTMVELDQPRTSHVLERGRYDARLEAVQPGTPASIMDFPGDLPTNRLGLARWLLDPSNPLAARVAVNRLWAVLFDSGIVATPEDFGSQGTMPSHPELLDELALDFVESGWDVKKMLKRMAMSTTYCQASLASGFQRQIDPENRLLSSGPSRRLSAEMVRDLALSTSGLLVSRIGGPSVYPYQPAGLWQEKSGNVYPQGTGEALHRRSLYTFWKLTSPPPSMMIFDAAKRDVCIARRQSTSTPLQALVLLNDPQYVEAACALAARAIREGGSTPADRVSLAWRLLTSRDPTSKELSVLVRLHDQELKIFQEDPEAALAVLAIARDALPGDENPAELAAMAIVCSTMLNADAAVMRR